MFLLLVPCALWPDAHAQNPSTNSVPSIGWLNWDQSISARLASGYKDNILLGHDFAEESPFVSAGFDWMLFRLPVDATSFYSFVSADYTRYLTAQNTTDEASALAQAQLKRDLNEFWSILGTAQYFFIDQVLDVSSLYREFTALKVEGHTFSGQPAIRRNLPWHSWTQLEFDVERDIFGRTLDDYWEGGPKLSLGHNYGHQSEAILSYEVHKRIYDRRTPRDRAGFSLPGHSLTMFEHEAGITLRHYWDKPRRWQSLIRAFVQRNADNGEGFYDFWRTKLSQQLRYRRKTWELQAEVGLLHYEYDVQTVSETDFDKRSKSILNFAVRGEYTVRKSLKVFSRYEHERSLSNIIADQYAVNTVQAGVEVEY